ncbi:MAG: hypothetical protein ABS95_03330 [Verrucomicrobia bacterium SCN 57-15]|nr:MAG: hypothetical protein ABS95_03330 [Verrucomicrobia bacterium SCN 57-15]
MTLLLLAIWPAVSSHGFLEISGLIHQQHADHEFGSNGSHHDGGDDHEAADGHCLLSSAQVTVPVPELALAPHLFVFLSFGWESELLSTVLLSGAAPPGIAPLQLSHGWQFSFRTALSPRAPSLLS